MLDSRLLTPRQREVLHWMAEGKRDREIGRILGISVRTAAGMHRSGQEAKGLPAHHEFG